MFQCSVKQSTAENKSLDTMGPCGVRANLFRCEVKDKFADFNWQGFVPEFEELEDLLVRCALTAGLRTTSQKRSPSRLNVLSEGSIALVKEKQRWGTALAKAETDFRTFFSGDRFYLYGEFRKAEKCAKAAIRMDKRANVEEFASEMEVLLDGGDTRVVHKMVNRLAPARSASNVTVERNGNMSGLTGKSVGTMAPQKRICFTGRACSLARCAGTNC